MRAAPIPRTATADQKRRVALAALDRALRQARGAFPTSWATWEVTDAGRRALAEEECRVRGDERADEWAPNAAASDGRRA